MKRSKIPSVEIAALKSRVSLTALIGESVPLQRDTRTEYLGLCPFHVEDTPSFRVWPDHYHCFGCGEHGDALSWLQYHERMSFAGAIHHLREWSGATEPGELDIRHTVEALAALTLRRLRTVPDVGPLGREIVRRLLAEHGYDVAHLEEKPPNIGRDRLLVHRRRALAAFSEPNLPQDIRDLYKQVADKAEAALAVIG